MFLFLLSLILIGASAFLYFFWKNNQYKYIKQIIYEIAGAF